MLLGLSLAPRDTTNRTSGLPRIMEGQQALETSVQARGRLSDPCAVCGGSALDVMTITAHPACR